MKRVSVKKVAKIVNGKTPKGVDDKFQEEGDIPFFRVSDMNVEGNDVEMCNARNSVSKKDAAGLKLRIAKPGTVIFPKRGGAISTNKKRILVKPSAYDLNTMGLTPNEKVNEKYFYYWFNSIDLGALADGSSVPQLNNKQIEPLEIPLPSLPEQKAIVAKLDRAQRLIDIDKEMLNKYDDLIQSVFLEMFGDPVTNTKGWDRVPFKKIAEIDKETFDPTDFAGSVEYVGLSSIVKDSGKIIDVETITEGDVKSNKYRFSPNHILYGKLRPYLNKVAFPDFIGVCSTDILPIKARDKVAKKSFVGYLLKTREFINYADTNSSGANLPRISPKMVKKFNAFQPPLELQAKFGDFVTRINSEKKKTLQASQKSEELFSSLVQGAFSEPSKEHPAAMTDSA